MIFRNQKTLPPIRLTTSYTVTTGHVTPARTSTHSPPFRQRRRIINFDLLAPQLNRRTNPRLRQGVKSTASISIETVPTVMVARRPLKQEYR